MKNMFLAFTALLLIPTVSYGQSFRALNPQVQQGDVMIFRIAPQWQAPAVVNPAIAIFGKHYLPNKYGYVFVGIDKSIAPGKHTATLVEYGRGVRLSIDYQEVEISERIYQIRKRTPGKPRNSKEVEAIKNAYAKGSPSESYVDSDFTLPLDKIVIDKDRVVGDVSSPFGGESHRGVDLITLDPKTGKHQRPVKAVNSGKVILVAKNFSLEGNMVIIDHGSGIFSIYAHLSAVNVKEGQPVKAEQAIALSGKSGRKTGPHLHFGIRVGDPTDPTKFPVVDPIRFIETMNSYIIGK